MFVKRVIRITANGKTFEGLRTITRIVKAGAPYSGQMQTTLFGLSLDDINELSTLAMLYRPQGGYEVAVSAGDELGIMWQIFKGTVDQAWGDFTNMPDVAFTITAFGSTAPAQVGSTQPTSATGSVQVAPLIQKLAQAGGLEFLNSGVNKTLHNVYTWGSPWKQIKEISEAANNNVFVDDKVCKIWNKGEPLSGNFEVSAKTGMRDYPTFIQNGIRVKVEYSRPVSPFSSFTVKSDLKSANATWNIISLDYDLMAEVPNGNWFVVIDGVKQDGQPRYYNNGSGGATQV